MTNEQVKVINILTREHDYPFGKAAWIAEEELYRFHKNLIDLIDEAVENSVYMGLPEWVNLDYVQMYEGYFSILPNFIFLDEEPKNADRIALMHYLKNTEVLEIITD
ncbi:MAG: hypothetical protein HUJ83_06440 [Veillonella sp.]|nr:hypothetical protein [Veillonella sp.]